MQVIITRPKMQSFLVILCTTMIVFHGISCNLFPHAVHNPLTDVHADVSKQYKRQALNVSELVQCVSEKLDDAFPDNSSPFVSDCKSAATTEFEISSLNIAEGISDLQSQVTKIYRSVCIRKCGNVVINAYDECGVFEILPGLKELSVSLCGTNQNGDLCYQLYGKGIALISTESSCYVQSLSSGKCGCHPELSQAVTEQGCCIKAYHDFLTGLGISIYKSLYNVCKIQDPTGCNNSPLIVD